MPRDPNIEAVPESLPRQKPEKCPPIPEKLQATLQRPEPRHTTTHPEGPCFDILLDHGAMMSC